MNITINAYTRLHHNHRHVQLNFACPQRVLSSAILNGGLCQASHILNLKVPKTLNTDEAPAASLRNYAHAQGWQGNVVGMMTAASMKSLRIERANIDGVDIAVLVTTGLDNARRAGDRAEVRELLATPEQVGTINLILICSAHLTDAAMVEAMMVATEAKAKCYRVKPRV